MKHLLLIAALLMNAPAFGNWVAESELDADTKTVYIRGGKARCEANAPIPGEPCFQPKADHSVQTVQVDDPSKPLYGSKLKVSAGLADLAACQAAMAGHCDDQSPGYAVRPVCAIEGEGPTHELYCVAEAPRSYEQMDVKRLLPDPAKAAARAAQRSALAQVESDVRNAARACYIKHRNRTVVAGDVIGCQKALYDFVKEIIKQLN